MRKPVVVISLFLLLFQIGVVTGCRGTRVPDDARLVAADSLLASDPDSALALVEALAPDSLSTEGDRAYRDLLLTQARYKCYITATSDSDINRALDYYRAHDSEQEKLTRAYIYKGAVMEELGHPDSAMLYYKHAEATAAPDDYFNLGYVNMRIATLYKDELSQDTTAILRYRKAIRYFTILNDTNYLISCYGNLGAFYGVNRPDSTEYCLSQAIDLAKNFNPSKQYTYKSKLAGFYYYYAEDYRRAKELAMDVFRNGKELSHEHQFYYYATWCYIKMGLLDSAKMILNATPAPSDKVDSMNWFKTVAEISKAEKDHINYGDNISQSYDAQMRIIADKQEDKLKLAENEYHKIQIESREASLTRSNHYLIVTLSVLFLAALLLTYLVIYLRRKNKERKIEIRNLEHSLSEIISGLEEKQRSIDQTQKDVLKLVSYRIDALHELFDSIKFKSKRSGAKDGIRTIVTLSGVVRGLSESYKPLKIELSDDFWEKMKISVDGELNGIVSFVESNYPILTEKELKLFTLLCAKISPQIIRMCLNYTHVNSVTNNRRIIINQKMGLDMTFEKFVEKYLKNEL